MNNCTLDTLLKWSDSRMYVCPHEIFELIGRAPKNPKIAARLAISRGRFPVETVLIAGRRMVDLRIFAAYLDASRVCNNSVALSPLKRQGRNRLGGAQ